MSQSHVELDPYVKNAENNNLTPQEKISGLMEIVKSTKTGMLTTRSSDGHFHSRAMVPSSLQFSYPPPPAYSDTQLTLIFLANNVSHKFEEIENDAHVNVSFCNTTTTSWASYSGKAKVTQDRELIKKHWSQFVTAWFGDLKDGVHKGDENDPRVAVIEVIPDEIRYWMATKGTVGRAVDIGVGAVTGKISAPGELRTITKEEIQLTQGLHTK